MKKFLSFDVGGTKIAYSIIDENGCFVGDVCKVATPKTAEQIQDLFKKIINDNYSLIDGIAFSTAGAVNNEETRITSFTGNLPQGYNMTNFEKLSDKPVLVENDANCAAWAEFILGSAKGLRNIIVLAIGTGIGAGIIVEGKLLKGKSGGAGEMHFPIDSGHKRCCQGCGQFDCFESFASGTGLKTTAQLFMGENATTYDVIEGKNNANKVAEEVFSEWQNYLTKGLIMLGNIFDPEMIVLSGSMAQFVEYNKLENNVNEAILTQPLKLCPAKFENNAGMLGAALLMAKKIKEANL